MLAAVLVPAADHSHMWDTERTPCCLLPPRLNPPLLLPVLRTRTRQPMRLCAATAASAAAPASVYTTMPRHLLPLVRGVLRLLPCVAALHHRYHPS